MTTWGARYVASYRKRTISPCTYDSLCRVELILRLNKDSLYNFFLDVKHINKANHACSEHFGHIHNKIILFSGLKGSEGYLSLRRGGGSKHSFFCWLLDQVILRSLNFSEGWCLPEPPLNPF